MYLLPELWIKIISYLDCKSILSLQLLSKNFYELCRYNDLYISRKLKGFPRIDGKAKIYEIEQTLDIYSIYNIDRTNKLRHEHLKKLLYIPVDIIRGDLVIIVTKLSEDCIHSRHTFIFDGQKLLETIWSMDGNLICPKFFINHFIPIDYWTSMTARIDLTHIDLIWFNVSDVRNELICNITFDPENMRFKTRYKIGDKSYYIEYINYEGISNDDIYLKLISIFNEKILIILNVKDYQNDLVGIKKDNTLYLTNDIIQYADDEYYYNDERLYNDEGLYKYE
jgi:hypothetical protein